MSRAPAAVPSLRRPKHATAHALGYDFNFGGERDALRRHLGVLKETSAGPHIVRCVGLAKGRGAWGSGHVGSLTARPRANTGTITFWDRKLQESSDCLDPQQMAGNVDPFSSGNHLMQEFKRVPLQHPAHKAFRELASKNAVLERRSRKWNRKVIDDHISTWHRDRTQRLNTRLRHESYLVDHERMRIQKLSNELGSPTRGDNSASCGKRRVHNKVAESLSGEFDAEKFRVEARRRHAYSVGQDAKVPIL